MSIKRLLAMMVVVMEVWVNNYLTWICNQVNLPSLRLFQCPATLTAFNGYCSLQSLVVLRIIQSLHCALPWYCMLAAFIYLTLISLYWHHFLHFLRCLDLCHLDGNEKGWTQIMMMVMVMAMKLNTAGLTTVDCWLEFCIFTLIIDRMDFRQVLALVAVAFALVTSMNDAIIIIIIIIIMIICIILFRPLLIPLHVRIPIPVNFNPVFIEWNPFQFQNRYLSSDTIGCY